MKKIDDKKIKGISIELDSESAIDIIKKELNNPKPKNYNEQKGFEFN